MFGTTKTSDRKRRMSRAAIGCEALEARNLTTGGLMGASGLAATPTDPPTVGLLLPAVQKVREAKLRA